MPDYEDAYLKAIHTARRQVLSPTGLPKQAYSELYILYASFLDDINRDMRRERIHTERIDDLRRIINGKMTDLAVQISNLYDDQKRQAVQLAVDAHKTGLGEALRITGIDVADVNWNAVPGRALDYMNARRGLFGSVNYKSVIKRRLESVAGEIDRYLLSTVARGVNSVQASQELAAILVGNDNRVLTLVNDSRLRKSDINRALREGDINPSDYKRARTALFDARRIIVTDVNTAHREGDLQASWESPVVGAKKWVVSGRHYGLPSTPDVCTVYHELDQFGMGAGVFPIQNFPAPPHAFCGCRGEDEIRSPRTWNDPKAQAVRPSPVTRDQLQQMFRDKTPLHLKRQVDLTNKYLRLAYRFAGEATQAA